jgi:L-alanine-DL-glutamate epimerase-like enolase superfamily enzyme
MKIIGVKIYPITMEFKRKIVESFGTVGQSEGNVIIQVFTDEGLSGLGESTTLGPYYSGESQGTVVSLIQEFIAPKILIGEDPFNIDKILYRMDKIVYRNNLAKTPIDIALYDILGKKLNLPAYKLLGGCYTDKIALRWSFGMGDPDITAQKARSGVDAGYTCVKMKVGDDPELDVERVAAVRKAVGEEVSITIDANQAYDPKLAIKTIKKMEDYNILYVEQPVDRDDLDGMSLVKNNVNIPIGACECTNTLEEVMQVIRRDAADFIHFKVSRSGGFYKGKQIIHMSKAAGLFNVGSTQLGLGIELAANAHFAASNMVLGEAPYDNHGYGSGLMSLFNSVDTSKITEDVVKKTPTIKEGYLYVPQEPGLGVEIDEAVVEKMITPGKKPITIGETSS